MTRTLSDSGLREYLKTVVNLEKSLYEQNMLGNTLNNKLHSLGNHPQLVAPSKPSLSDCISKIFSSLIVTIVVWWLIIIIPTLIAIFIPSLSSGIYLAIFLLLAILIVAVIFYRVNTYLSNCKNYTRLMAEYESNVDRMNNQIGYELNVVAPEVRKELDNVVNNYRNTRNLLQKLYDLDVIYPKYRNLIAVCAFYEYIHSGRCTQLEGHEGAINLYESEIRLNRIICQLDDVLVSLDEIKESQRELFNVISDANEKTQRLWNSTNSRLESMDNKMSELVEMNQYNMSIIAQNTSVLAYYEQQIRSGRY